MNNPNCCGNGPHSGPEVRVLPLSTDSNLILCRQCFAREILWRRGRLQAGVPFELPEWEDLKVYPEEVQASKDELSDDLSICLNPNDKITISFAIPGKNDSTHRLAIEYDRYDGLVRVQHDPDEDHTILTYTFNA